MKTHPSFAELQERLPEIWEAIEKHSPWDHTSVVVPSLSFHPEELAKIPGAPFYEERLLFLLIRLRHPKARVIYVTSQPIHPEIVDYYLHHLVGVPALRARQRLKLVCVHDASLRPLTEKILERPRVVERLRQSLGDRRWAYLTCFNSTALERRLAETLGIPLNGVDPELLALGTKSGSRKIFAAAGVEYPAGREDVRREDEVVDTLCELAELRPGLGRAVVKLNESFAGAGNGIYRYPAELPREDAARRRAIATALRDLEWSATESYERFLAKIGEMGGVVEEFIEVDDLRSPSVQMRIQPNGAVEVVSTHEQVLGGTTGQTYVGCRFPADEIHRAKIQRDAAAIAEVLRQRSVVGRFGIDFVTWNDPEAGLRTAAIEINLRMGGTTPPFLALEFLTGGRLDEASGQFQTPEGRTKFYYATDRLESPAYRGLLPEDFLDILTSHGLGFKPSTETGVLFHMIGALSEFGKVGVTCIGDSQEEADELYRSTAEILDRETRERPESVRSTALGKVRME